MLSQSLLGLRICFLEFSKEELWDVSSHSQLTAHMCPLPLSLCLQIQVWDSALLLYFVS